MFISKYSTYVSISVAPDHVSLHVAEGVCLIQDRYHERHHEYGEVLSVSISVAPEHVSLHVAEAVCLMQDRHHDQHHEYGVLRS